VNDPGQTRPDLAATLYRGVKPGSQHFLVLLLIAQAALNRCAAEPQVDQRRFRPPTLFPVSTEYASGMVRLLQKAAASKLLRT